MRIGIDIGGTGTDAVLTDDAGVVLARHGAASGQGNAAVLRTARDAATALCRSAEVDLSDIDSIGVGVPGRVEDGRLFHAINLSVTELDVAGELGRTWGLTPRVENDVNAAAVGAWALESPRPRSLAYLNVGTGLAAGFVIDGQLWRGARGASGEIGYVIADPDGPEDAEGVRGRLETYASGSGITQQWGVPGATAIDVMYAADEGDARAVAIRDGLVFGVATAARLIIMTMDVDRVVVGGGLVRLGAPLIDGVNARLHAGDAESAFVYSLELASRLTWLDPETPVSPIGAAMLGALP